MKRIAVVGAALGLFWMAVPKGQGTLAVVPGAPNTYGMNTRAAYACGSNPTIYHVTSLADSGAGTFREAVMAIGPRVVIFERSGYIAITSNIVINNPCLTVAGQTAPSPGITIRGSGSIPTETALYLNTHDVLLQHFAIRPGASTCNAGMQVYGGSQQNLVFDHMSFSWGQDENLAFNWTNGQSTQATVWRSIFAEGLYQAAGSNLCTGGGVSNGHGILIDTDAKHIAVIQSIFANNSERNPYMLGDTNTALINNLTYQPHGPWGFFYNNGSVCGPGCGTNDPWYSSVVGNRYIKGPNSCCQGGGDDTVSYQMRLSVNGTDSPDIAGNKLYFSDNTIANQDGTIIAFSGTAGSTSNGYSYNPTVGAAPSEAPLPGGISLMASTAVEAFVKANSGARPADRDAVDTRILACITARAGCSAYISTPTTVGGYPTLAVNTRALTTPMNAHVVQASGYTALEEWLHQYAGIVEGANIPPPGPADPGAATGTVIVSATFTGAVNTPLTSYTSGTGGGWALATGSTGVLLLSDAGRVRSDATTEGSLTLAAGIPLTAQYDVDVDLVIKTLIAGDSYGIWGKTLTTANTGYFNSVDVDSSMVNLVQVINGAYNTLTSCAVTLTPATTVHFTGRFRNTSQHAIINGTQCTSTADHTIATVGQAGLSVYGPTADSQTTGIHFDNFVVRDVLTATPSAPRLRLRFAR